MLLSERLAEKFKEGFREGFREGFTEGKEIGKYKCIMSTVKHVNSLDDALSFFGVSKEEFDKLHELYKELI